MNRHVSLPGTSLALFVMSILISSLPRPGSVLADPLGVPSSYLLYCAVISLPTMSRVEEESQSLILLGRYPHPLQLVRTR